MITLLNTRNSCSSFNQELLHFPMLARQFFDLFLQIREASRWCLRVVPFLRQVSHEVHLSHSIFRQKSLTQKQTMLNESAQTAFGQPKKIHNFSTQHTRLTHKLKRSNLCQTNVSESSRRIVDRPWLVESCTLITLIAFGQYNLKSQEKYEQKVTHIIKENKKEGFFHE